MMALALHGTRADGTSLDRATCAAAPGAWEVLGIEWARRVTVDARGVHRSGSGGPKVLLVGGPDVTALRGPFLRTLGAALTGRGTESRDLLAEIAARVNESREAVTQVLGPCDPEADQTEWLTQIEARLSGQIEALRRMRRGLAGSSDGPSVAELKAEVERLEAAYRALPEIKDYEVAIAMAHGAVDSAQRALARAGGVSPPDAPRPETVPDLSELANQLHEAQREAAVLESRLKGYAGVRQLIEAGRCPKCRQKVDAGLFADTLREAEEVEAEYLAARATAEALQRLYHQQRQVAELAAEWRRYDEAQARLRGYEEAYRRAQVAYEAVLGEAAQHEEETADLREQKARLEAALTEARQRLQGAVEREERRKQHKAVDAECKRMEALAEAVRALAPGAADDAGVRAVCQALSECGIGTVQVDQGRLVIVRDGSVIEPSLLSSGESRVWALNAAILVARARPSEAYMLIADNLEVMDAAARGRWDAAVHRRPDNLTILAAETT